MKVYRDKVNGDVFIRLTEPDARRLRNFLEQAPGAKVIRGMLAGMLRTELPED